MSVDKIKREVEEEVREMLFQATGDVNPRELQTILGDIFNKFPEGVLKDKSQAASLITEQKNRLLTQQNTPKPEQDLTLQTQSKEATIDNSSNQEEIESQNLYERLYCRVIAAIGHKNTDTSKQLLRQLLSEIQDLGIDFEAINDHVQKIYPGCKIVSHFAIHEKISEYPYQRPFTKNDLFVAILNNDKNAIREINTQTKGALLFEKDCNNSTPLNYFAFLENYMDYQDILIPEVGSNEEEVSEFIQNSRSRFVTGLSYSTQNFAGLFGYGYEHLMSLALKDTKDFEHKNVIQESLGALKSKHDHILKDNPDFSKIKIVEAPYPTHAAYFIVKYDKEGQAKKISYCDGNLIHDRKHGEIVFDIDPEKLKKIGSIDDFLEKEFQEVYASKNGAKDIRGKFNAAISQLVTTKEGTPKITEKNIPASYQNRGNCAYKSMNLAERAIQKEINPRSGHESFKEYKKLTTQNSISNLLNTAEKEDFRTKVNHDQIIEDLKPMFLQSIKKGHEKVTSRIANIFEKENVDIKEIRGGSLGNMNVVEIFDALKQRQEQSLSSPKQDKALAIIANLKIDGIWPDSKTNPREKYPTRNLLSQENSNLSRSVY